MKVGVPKEIKTLEFRVGMTPAGVRELVHDGHDVFVENNAGLGIGMTDADYEAAGAKVLGTAKEVFDTADLIIKVKEPQLNECAMLRDDQVLFTYLHLAADPEQTRALVESGTTAIAYETVTAKDGSLPLLTPMSEVAGRLSIQSGAYHLQKANGGRGVLLGGVPGVKAAKVLVIGGGVSGFNAADMAIGMGAPRQPIRLVGDPSAPRAVGKGHTAGLVGFHDPRHFEERIGPEGKRVEKILPHPPVNHIDPLQPPGGAHHHLAILDHQVPSLE